TAPWSRPSGRRRRRNRPSWSNPAVRHAQQIVAVAALAQRFTEGAKLGGVDPTLLEGDLLDAADAQALALFDGAYELPGLDQAVMGAGVEPGEAAAKDFHAQLAGLEIEAVEVGDLQFAARR